MYITRFPTIDYDLMKFMSLKNIFLIHTPTLAKDLGRDPIGGLWDIYSSFQGIDESFIGS